MSSIRSDFGAIPIRISIGAPNKIPKLLPLNRLLAAGVLYRGSTSRRSITPELMVPVIIPYMDKNDS